MDLYIKYEGTRFSKGGNLKQGYCEPLKKREE